MGNIWTSATPSFSAVGQTPQVEALRKGVDVLVATPGRLNDLCNQGHIDLRQIETFVLDEADRMLDMGFIHDVRKVISRLPQRRQTLLFSATMPQEIAQLSKQILHNPVRVEVTPQSSTVDAIDQRVYKVDRANKKPLLQHVLQTEAQDSVLVFTNTKHRADRVVKDLAKAGIAAMAIHGNKGQTARVTALENFKSGKIRVLVATDIAARGIDVNELSCVINYDLPNVPETYVHRIGRTGRAGHSGLAISFCDFEEQEYLKTIEKLIGKTVPEVSGHPWPMKILEAAPKAQRPPRPAKAAGTAAPKQPEKQQAAARKSPPPVAPRRHPEKHGEEKPAVVKTPAPAISASVHSANAALTKLPKAAQSPAPLRPARKISSEPRAIPGRVVAFADGRRSSGRKRPKGGRSSAN